MNNHFKLGKPLNVIWHFKRPDGENYSLAGLQHELVCYNSRGRFKIKDSVINVEDTGVLSFTLKEEMQTVEGAYSFYLSLLRHGKTVNTVVKNDAIILSKHIIDTDSIQEDGPTTIDIFSVGEFELFRPTAPVAGSDGWWYFDGQPILDDEGNKVPINVTIDIDDDPESETFGIITLDKGRDGGRETVITGMRYTITAAIQATESANAAAENATKKGDYAKEQGDYAKEQGANVADLKNKVTEYIKNHKPVVINGNVNNAPDEEDITSNDKNLLQFKNRSTLNGMGYIILRKNKPFAEQLTQSNTIYEIRYDFDLGGSEVTIPEGCVLDFQGGSITNGSINGNTTSIKAGPTKIFNTDVTFEGSWNVADVYSEWFDWSEQESHTRNMKNLTRLCVSSSNTNLFLANRTYYIDGYDTVNDTPYVVSIPSFTHIYNSGTIQIKKSTNNQSFPISLTDVENIIIEGGKINGNVRLLESSPGEQGYGISLRGTKNIVIRDIEIDECFGDGINLQYNTGSTNLLHNTNISISNVVLQRNSRQGISIEDGEDIFINNLIINDTSSILPRNPGAGIDIEPSYTNAVIGNININNCIFKGGKSSIIILNGSISEYGDIRISNCLGDKNLYIAQANSTNAIIYVFNCKFNELYNDALNIRTVKNAIFENCEFKIDINNQNISDFTFRKCTLNGIKISNSTVDNITVTDSIVYCDIIGAGIKYRNCQIISESTSLNNITGYFYNCILEAYNYFKLYGSDGILENCKITNKVSYDADWGVITAGSSGANITVRNCDIVPKIAGRYILRGYYNLSTNAVFNIFGGTISPFNKTHMTNPIKATIVYNKGFSAFDEILEKPIYWTGSKWVDAEGKELNNFLTQGTTAQRPTGVNDGFEYYDTDLDMPIYWDARTQRWLGADGFTAGYHKGDDESRPALTLYDQGFTYWDVFLNKLIVWNGNAWVDSNGTEM